MITLSLDIILVTLCVQYLFNGYWARKSLIEMKKDFAEEQKVLKKKWDEYYEEIDRFNNHVASLNLREHMINKEVDGKVM